MASHGRCVPHKECAPVEYWDAALGCKPCHAKCFRCTGPTEDQCRTCPRDSLLLSELLFLRGGLSLPPWGKLPCTMPGARSMGRVFLIFHFVFGTRSNLQKRQKRKERHTGALYPLDPLLILHPVCPIVSVVSVSVNVNATIYFCPTTVQLSMHVNLASRLFHLFCNCGNPPVDQGPVSNQVLLLVAMSLRPPLT